MARATHKHHIVYDQELRRRWDGEAVMPSGVPVRERWRTWKALYRDPRNLFDICTEHHFNGQHGRNDPIPLSELPDEALEFAFELLGSFAYDYLQRRYAGADPRLESHLAAAA